MDSHHQRPSPDRPVDCDVVVIGAGPAGLAAATELARRGVDVLVLEKRTEVSDLPRAVGVSLRQMEVLRSWGLEPDLVAGAEAVDLALLETRTLAEAAHGTRLTINVPDASQSAVVSPTTAVRVPQDHLERVMAAHLAGFGNATIRRGTEVLEIAQDATAVELTADGPDGVRRVRASYAVAADGAHSPTRDLLGVGTVGVDGLMNGVSAEFRADLWPLLDEHRYALYGVRHPEAGGVVIPAGRGRWQLGVVAGPADDVEALATPGPLVRRIRRAVGVPDLPVELGRVHRFSAGAKLATRFATGRVLLAGDAAHRVTPKGGNGLTLALRSGVALGWRLSWVIRGWAPPGFLATYEEEARPVAEESVARAADPQTRCHHVLTELLHDLGGRLQHAWVGGSAPDETPVSTLDLIGDGLTLVVSGPAAVWRRAAAQLDRPVPVTVTELPRHVGHGLGVRPGGALLVRPDAVPVALWYASTDAGRAVADLERAVDDLFSTHPVTTGRSLAPAGTWSS